MRFCKQVQRGFRCSLHFQFIRHISNMTKKHDRVRKRERVSLSSDNDATKKYKHDYRKDYSDKSWPYHKGKLDTTAKIVLLLFPIIVATGITYMYYKASLKEMVRMPLGDSLVISEKATSAVEDPLKFWGTYRPNLYFGIKARIPQSPVFGLMWMAQMGQESPPPIRHWCDQGDRIPMYGWFAHDGVNFGVQEIVDHYYTVSTDFVKRPGGTHGGDWSARFRVQPRHNLTNAIMSLFFYTALDGQGDIHANLKKNHLLSIDGSAEGVGRFQVLFPDVVTTSPKVKHNYLVTYAPSLANLKEKVSESLVVDNWDKSKGEHFIALGGKRMPKDFPEGSANFIVHQVTAELPLEMEVLYQSESNFERKDQLTGPVFQEDITRHLNNFAVKFDETFKLKQKGFPTDQIHFAQAVLSNMLGGIGYFYGSSLVKSRYTQPDEVLSYWDAPLYTAVPSRSFFPRGFLWDEGFHNLLIEKWDQRLSMDIIGHWLDLMNVEGWIPREQILGPEARARVPPEFVIQYNENANPPTLFLPLQSIVKNLIGSDDPKDKQYLTNLYPRLKAWYSWFNTTQIGPRPFSYMWKGRDPNIKREINPKTLTSGLDDYPRASHPTPDEYHVDLRCWMALASGVMADIAKSVNESWEDYHTTYTQLTDNRILDELHWSTSKQRYADFGLHSDDIKLVRPKPPTPRPGQKSNPNVQLEKERQVRKDPSMGLVDSTFGYVSLFPFLLKIVEPSSLKLGQILSDLQDPNLLWTKYGLRSLARSSPLYNKHNTEHDPPYWRGNIWININYLALGALYHYAEVEGPYKEQAKSVYLELRANIISNMYEVYRTTGYIWENYNDKDGKGKGCHPFTGWSALVVAIMAEQY